MNKTLGTKVLLSVLAISAVMAVTLAAVQIGIEHDRETRAVDDRFRFIETSILPGLVNSLWVLDEEQLRLQMTGTLDIADIVHLELFANETGATIALGTRPDGPARTRDFDLVRDFRGQPKVLGRLRITADMTPLIRRQRERAVTILGAEALRFFLVSLVVLLVVHRLVTLPLARLARHARDLDPGHLETPLPDLSRPLDRWPDAIDDMAAALLNAQGRIRDATDALARLNRDLERTVDARTRALQASEERYRQLFERSKAVELLIDPDDGRIVDANLAAQSFYGHDAEHLRRMNVADINVLSRQEVHDEMARAEAEQRNYFLFRHRLASGEIRDVEVHSGPIDMGDRTILYSIVHDVTLRRKAERELQATLDELMRSNRELERFAYIASHDLQEPVRTVTSFAQILERRFGDRLDADAHEYLSFVVAGAKRMGALVRDLLAYSRTSSRDEPFEPVALERVLDAALANLAHTLNETGTRVERQPLPVVSGHEVQLIELFQNLITNAVKFRHPARPCEIRIGAARRGVDWEISVADNGIGIEPEYHEQIFEIFRRLHTAAAYPGTGIGLAVCRRVVERHGGKIRVQSTPGAGTTFLFTCPAIEAAAAGPAAA